MSIYLSSPFMYTQYKPAVNQNQNGILTRFESQNFDSVQATRLLVLFACGGNAHGQRGEPCWKSGRGTWKERSIYIILCTCNTNFGSQTALPTSLLEQINLRASLVFSISHCILCLSPCWINGGCGVDSRVG